MADIILKDRHGFDRIYTGVTSVTFNTTDGDTVTFGAGGGGGTLSKSFPIAFKPSEAVNNLTFTLADMYEMVKVSDVVLPLTSETDTANLWIMVDNMVVKMTATVNSDGSTMSAAFFSHNILGMWGFYSFSVSGDIDGLYIPEPGLYMVNPYEGSTPPEDIACLMTLGTVTEL